MGWPYFSWSLGYNTNRRDAILKQFFISSNLKQNCSTLKDNKINYIIIQNKNDFPVNKAFIDENYQKVYENIKSGVTIYNVKNACNF